MGKRVLVVVALMVVPCVARAGGHRAEAGETYSALLGVGSTASGFGKSFGLPLCLVTRLLTPRENCKTNEWSLVAAYSQGLTATHGEPLHVGDVEVQYVLAGVRRTFPIWGEHGHEPGDVVPFVHALVGGVRRREVGNPERFGGFGSGGAATATLGAEFVLVRFPLNTDLRFRAQVAGAVFTIGNDTRWTGGYAFALSFGYLVD